MDTYNGDNINDCVLEDLSEVGTGIDIEASDDDEYLEPFNPEEISIQQRIVSMDVILRRLRQKTINLTPSFQRKMVWDQTRKSRLIESIMLQIPLPMFYVAANDNAEWEVVDGLQRLSTIRDFLIGDENGVLLKLKNLEFLGDKFNDQTFLSIERDHKEQRLINKIYETELRFTVIDPGTPEAVKRNIFKRINTGGMPLTSQEIRHALYEGESSNLLREFVDSTIFKQVAGKKVDDSRLGASELVLRLIAFMLFDREQYKTSMDAWLSNAMRVLNILTDISEEQLQKIFSDIDGSIDLKIKNFQEIKQKFYKAMERCYELFGSHAFRKSLPNEERRSPINKSLFEVWGNVLADLPQSEYDMLLSNKEILFEKYSALLKKIDFNNAISRHSSSYKGIKDSYNSILELVNAAIFPDKEFHNDSQS